VGGGSCGWRGDVVAVGWGVKEGGGRVCVGARRCPSFAAGWACARHLCAPCGSSLVPGQAPRRWLGQGGWGAGHLG
jgi:hypothetical protein